MEDLRIIKRYSQSAFVAGLTQWKQIAEYVDQGKIVYYRHENRRVVKHRGKYAIVDAETGELQEPDINLIGEKARVFYVIIPFENNTEAPKIEVKTPPGIMNRLPRSIDRSDKFEAHKAMRKRHHKEWFEAGQTQPSRKRQGQGKSIGLVGFYVNKRRAFSVDEFAAIHERFKQNAIAKHAQAMAKLNK